MFLVFSVNTDIWHHHIFPLWHHTLLFLLFFPLLWLWQKLTLEMSTLHCISVAWVPYVVSSPSLIKLVFSSSVVAGSTMLTQLTLVQNRLKCQCSNVLICGKKNSWSILFITFERIFCEERLLVRWKAILQLKEQSFNISLSKNRG